jgi:hypothetical protein
MLQGRRKAGEIFLTWICRCATKLADSQEFVRIWRFRLDQGVAGLGGSHSPDNLCVETRRIEVRESCYLYMGLCNFQQIGPTIKILVGKKKLQERYP